MSPSITAIIAVLTVLGGMGTVIFVALRFRREEAEGFVKIMRDLSDELQTALDRTKEERDELRVEVVALRKEVSRLRRALENFNGDPDAI